MDLQHFIGNSLIQLFIDMVMVYLQVVVLRAQIHKIVHSRSQVTLIKLQKWVDFRMREEHRVRLLCLEQLSSLFLLLISKGLFSDDTPDPEKVKLLRFALILETCIEHGRVAVALG